MRALAALALVGVAAGCASFPAAGGGNYSTLDAYLLPGTGFDRSINFHVSRPAHVAVFHIVPGRGTSMVYPSFGSSSSASFVHSGFHRVNEFGRGFNQDQYLPALYANSAQPSFYFMIASEEPLSIGQFGSYGYGLSSAMGMHFAATTAYSAMDQLVSLVVPDINADTWTTDYYVDWGDEDALQPRREALVQIRCNDRVYNVRASDAAWAAEQLCRPATDTEPPPSPPLPGDSIIEPVRREPVPVAERISSTQLRDPEVWSEMRRIAESGGVDADADNASVERMRRPSLGSSNDETFDRTRRGASDGGARAGGSATARPRAGDDSTPERARPAPERERAPIARPSESPAARPSSPPPSRAPDISRPNPRDEGSITPPDSD